MATVHDEITPRLSRFVLSQPVFFVGTAPLAGDGHVNVSPKGMGGTFVVLDPHRVAYLDYTGSGAEAAAHLQENGRIVVVEVDRVSDSCGYSVPFMDFVGDRDLLDRAHDRRDPEYFDAYWHKKNATSIDGLPGVDISPVP